MLLCVGSCLKHQSSCKTLFFDAIDSVTIPQSQIICQLCFYARREKGRKSAKKYNLNEFSSFVYLFLEKHASMAASVRFSFCTDTFNHIHSNDALYHPHNAFFTSNCIFQFVDKTFTIKSLTSNNIDALCAGQQRSSNKHPFSIL